MSGAITLNNVTLEEYNKKNKSIDSLEKEAKKWKDKYYGLLGWTIIFGLMALGLLAHVLKIF